MQIPDWNFVNIGKQHVKLSNYHISKSVMYTAYKSLNKCITSNRTLIPVLHNIVFPSLK